MAGAISAFAIEIIITILIMSPMIGSFMTYYGYGRLFFNGSITPEFLPSLIGLLVGGFIKSFLFEYFQKSITGTDWKQKGMIWGLVIAVFSAHLVENLLYLMLDSYNLFFAIISSLITLGISITQGMIISKILFTQEEESERYSMK